MTAFPGVVLNRDEDGEVLRLPFGTFTVRVSGEQTGGTLSVVESELPAGAVGAAPHVHHGHEEYFLITAGEVTFDLEDGVEVVGAGGAVAVPRGRPHGFRNAGSVPAVILGLFTPAGYENYFREVAAAFAAGVQVTPELLAELRAKQQTVSWP
jgi:quercetin dioxygenase-like cupin family protein